MLPCEFCEELFPEEELILHQTGCNPASAFASMGKRPPSPRCEDRMARGARGLMHIPPSDAPAPTLPAFPRSVSPLSCSPPSSPLEGDVVIPCEFCGVALEEAVVFHHQDKCDLRPRTAQPADKVTKAPFPKPSLPPKESRGPGSPDMQRRLKHQADPLDELFGLDKERPPMRNFKDWQRGPSGLPTLGKVSNCDARVKNRPQQGAEAEGAHSPFSDSHKSPFSDGNSHKSNTSTAAGPPQRVNNEGRRKIRNIGPSKLPKKQNEEQEEEE